MFSKKIGCNVEVYVNDMLVKSKANIEHLDDLRETFDTLQKYKMKLNPTKCSFGVSLGKFLSFMVSQKGIEANLEKVKVILEMMSPKTMKEVQRLTRRVVALNRIVSKAIDKWLPIKKAMNKPDAGNGPLSSISSTSSTNLS